MFEKLSNEAYELLIEILEHETEKDYWKNRFKGLSNREDTILRGCFKELREKNLVSVNWADNIPYRIQVLKDGYLYEKHRKEMEEQMSGEKKQMKDYEVLLSKLIEKANKKDFYVLAYKYQQGEKLLIEKLKDEKLITEISYQGHDYVSARITYEGYHYFDKKEVTDASKSVNDSDKKMYDVFLSHASADKLSYVDELKEKIDALGVSVFYDKDAIEWGDHWKQKIYEGLEKSEFAIIVISKNFFGREWTEEELTQLLHRQNSSGQKIILPIVYGISTDELKEKYPEVADIQAISTNDYSCEMISILFARQLIKRLKEL